MSFSSLNLVDTLVRAVAAEGYDEPTPIQKQAIPRVLEGRDLLGCAQTGTGKTAAFSLPLLQLLASRKGTGIRALVLSPTRELAAQIGERMTAYGRLIGVQNTVIFGGVSQFHQVRALKTGPAVVVATPGRLLDLCSQRIVDLSRVEILVLDEADRMLDMGFIHDVRKIVGMLPKNRQTLFFSATMPKDIVDLARSILRDPVRVDVAPQTKTADTVRQAVLFVSRADKRRALERFLDDPAIDRALVFTRTKHGASRVASQLDRSGIASGAIHGDKTQGARERALGEFRAGKTRVLVATDIAARGIDVDGISHVVNYDVPVDPDTYVHRIGRTGRAGATGLAVSFCDPEERPLLKNIERLIQRPIPVWPDPSLGSAPPAEPAHASGDGGGSPRREPQRQSAPGRPDAQRPAARGPRPHGPKQGNEPSGGGPRRRRRTWFGKVTRSPGG